MNIGQRPDIGNDIGNDIGIAIGIDIGIDIGKGPRFLRSFARRGQHCYWSICRTY